MTSDRYQGNIISTTPVEPQGTFGSSPASGAWSLGEVFSYVKAGLWPIPGNFPPNVEDVFSTYLYDGNSSTQTITNGIDLAGEGGLVWIKQRSGTRSHLLYDDERAGLYPLLSNSTGGELTTVTNGVTALNSDGFSLSNLVEANFSGATYASWTFRKAPKFFDVVTYTGDGTNGRLISHNLGSVPGVIITKPTSQTDAWNVYHRSLSDDNASWCQNLFLNTTDPEGGYGRFSPHASQTDTHFSLYNDGNKNGVTYVAYLFAHNDGDGEFGPDGDADIIKCGSYTGTGADGNFVDLGFEPQWVMIKRADGTGDWNIFDNMRGMAQAWYAQIKPNKSDAESANSTKVIPAYPTGFEVNLSASNWNASGSNYIYIAIRRGTKVPESGTEVFATEPMTSGGPPDFVSGFPVDFALHRVVTGTGNWDTTSRLQGNVSMKTNDTTAESAQTYVKYDYQNGFFGYGGAFANYQAWMWKRASNFFDVVAVNNSTSGTGYKHNLGVVPEMMIVKERDAAGRWFVYHSSLGAEEYILLDSTNVPEVNSGDGGWNDTAPTSTEFTLGSFIGRGNDIIAYLFASLDGVSKVGSYTGNGTSQTIDCGFTSGARFILVKRTDSTGDWYVWDTERGIVAGNDPYLELNTTDAEVTSTDWVDPDNSGFIVNGTTINASSAEYIFYAVA